MTEKVSLDPLPFGDTLPLTTTINIPEEVDFKESTTPSKLPPFRRVLQKIGDDFVTSSFLDQNSSFSTLEALSIDAKLRTDVTSSGYPRNPYLGIASRLDSEDNTLAPYYDIPPRADFNDVGTVSYFHKESGEYSYDIYTLYKQQYVVKLDTNVDSPLDRLYAPITLLPTGSIVAEYGRNTTTIPSAVYSPNSQAVGVIKVANIFTLYGLTGASGLRLRMYANSTDRSADF